MSFYQPNYTNQRIEPEINRALDVDLDFGFSGLSTSEKSKTQTRKFRNPHPKPDFFRVRTSDTNQFDNYLF